MRVAPVELYLPALLLREIGHVIVSFAGLEFQLSLIVYDHLGVGDVEGRLAVREPRATDRLDLIYDLLSLRKIEPPFNTAAFRSSIEAIQRQRDQLAHGIWFRKPGTRRFYLRITKGSWQPIPGQKKVKRLVQPEAVLYTREDAIKLCLYIQAAILAVQQLRVAIHSEREASPQKSRGRSRRSHRLRGQTAIILPDPLKPSRA